MLPVSVPGELRTIATLADGCSNLRWSPDGTWIAFTSRTRDERYDAKDESWQAPRKIERFAGRLNGEDWVFDRPEHIYVVPAAGGAAPTNLTPGPFQHDGVSWLPDSSGVVTSAARHDEWDLDLSVDLYVVELDTTGRDADHPHTRIRSLTEHSGTYDSPSVSPDGRLVAFLGADDPLEYPQNFRVGVIDLGSGERRWISSALDRTFAPTSGAIPPVWLSDTAVVAGAEDRGDAHLFRLDPTGSTPPVALTEGRRWVGAFDAAGGTIVASIATHDHPAEIFALGAGDGASDGVQLSTVTASYTAKVNPVGWEHFTVPCVDPTAGTGEEIDAWILRPAGFDPAQRYPVLLNVHGGPHSQYGESFFDEAQMQAAAGFVVVMSNPRGSSGREQAWGQAIMGPKHATAPGSGWGGLDLADVLAVLDAALDRYDVLRPAASRHARRQLRRLHGDAARRHARRAVPGDLQRTGGQQPAVRGVVERHRHVLPSRARAGPRQRPRGVPADVTVTPGHRHPRADAAGPQRAGLPLPDQPGRGALGRRCGCWAAT